MEVYYRPYRRDIREVLAIGENARLFSQNILTHLKNISSHARNTAPKVKQAAINTPTNIYNFGSGMRFYTKVLIKYTRKLAGMTPFLDMYDAMFGYYVNDLVKFLDEVVSWGVITANNARVKYRARHLTNGGEAPVITNIGLSSDSRDNITFSGDFKRIISRNQKNNGIVLINSAGSFYGSADYARKIGGRVAIASNNGALITVTNAKGQRIVLQDRKIPKDTVLTLYKYLNEPSHRDLMKDYYMVIEGDVEGSVAAVDFASGKVRLSNSKNVHTSEAEFMAAINNAYGIRFVAKESFDLNKREGKNSWVSHDKLDKGATANDKLASTAAAILASLPNALRSQISNDVDVQFGRNGSVDLVPKGCSKLRAAQIVANYYGLDRGQILTLATSVNDVCAPTTLNALAENLKNGANPQELINSAIKIDEYLLQNGDRLGISAGFMQNYNVECLTKKFDRDLVDANQRRHEEALEREFNEFANEEKAKLSQIVDASKKELDSIDQSAEENKEKCEAIKKKVEFAVATYKNNLLQKRAELEGRPVESKINRAAFMVDNMFDLAGKICGLSKNENYSTRRAPEATPTLSK